MSHFSLGGPRLIVGIGLLVCAPGLTSGGSPLRAPGANLSAAASGEPGITTGAGLPTPLPSSAGAGFYVSPTGDDAASGSEDRPWRTLQKAMTSLAPGEKAYIRAGTYSSGKEFGTSEDTHTWSRTCMWTAPCSILAYPGEKPVIRGQVRLEGDYLRLSGLIIEGPLSRDVSSCSERRDNQVQIIHASYIELSNNEVRNNDYHAGIGIYGNTRYIQLLNNWIHDNGRFTITVDPCTGNEVDETDHGIYWSKGVGPGNLIANNLVEHNRSKGVQLYRNGTYDVLITNNTIVGNGGSGIVLNGKTDRITIVNNVVAYNGTYQIRILTGDDNLVRRNLTYPAGVVNTTSSTATDNEVAEPRFVDREGRDWRLLPGSPAVDRALAQWATTTALDGSPRPAGAGPDLGAFER